RFRAALQRWGGRLRERLFSEDEIRYCMGKRDPETHLAARFAAKEAVFKALGTPLGFREIEVTNGEKGKPEVRVTGLLEDDYHFNLSISHDGEYAVAQVLVEKY
ncbi:MAG: holo-ACP synthase, partial [Thermodesulfobacteriota bacterium]